MRKLFEARRGTTPAGAERPRLARRLALAAVVAAAATAAGAQVVVNPLPPGTQGNGVFNAFPKQNPMAPTGPAFQSNYPYPGQCLADFAANTGLFPLLLACPNGGSFAPYQRTAGDWAVADPAGAPIPFRPLNPILPAGQAKFAWPVLNPPDYTPDTTTFPGADYYELGVHEAWGFDGLAKAGLFPNPGAAVRVPDGLQWTGLTCNIPGGCKCPADASPTYPYCVNGLIPQGSPLFTPIWGIGQINNAGGPVTSTLAGLGLFAPGTATPYSANNYVSTWPSISVRAQKGRPVVVKWVNEFPNNHVLCPHPEAADWPCSIDRTFMGVKTKIDPGLAHAVPPERVNQYGSPQQPDNSWVTHLHGGEIPPSTDGFAEKWHGNAVTAAAYVNPNVNPPFENPSDLVLTRPLGNFDTYTYPMVQEEATIWFHDHTLGKTHHNVIAGPAGFFPVVEPAKHGGTGAFAGKCPVGEATCTSEYTWLDPVTQPRNALGIPLYDLFLAVQDRAFNEDGSINFSNGLGQVIPAGAALSAGYSSVTPGVNPQVHPTWLPEYFGDHALVNGVLWPRYTAAAGWHRLRIVDGSDSRCYTIGFSTRNPAPGTLPNNNIHFFVIANDQGYLRQPVRTRTFTMCPGERYELLINFEGRQASRVYMTNTAPAPFPVGIAPNAVGSPFADMNVIMRFDIVNGTPQVPAVVSCGVSSWDPTWVSTTTGQASMKAAIAAKTACMLENPARVVADPAFRRIPPVIPAGGVATIPFPAGSVVRQVYLNERLDGITLLPFGMQLNGVPFEYKVTETPRKGTREYWQFINLTVDTHPIHPHLVKHQIVARQSIDVGLYKAALCGSIACQPGPVPGGEMQVIPDVNAFILPGALALPPAPFESGWKDATQVPPNQVTTIVADWVARWPSSPTAAGATAPGTAGCPNGTLGCAAPYVYEDVTSGPYVWHCHINSHEDSEMMRTSLVVP